MALAAYAQGKAGSDAVQEWTRARSVSEAIKSEVYSGLAGFGKPDPWVEVQRLTGDATDLTGHRAGIKPKSRSLPAVMDVDTYLKERVDKQISWYLDKRAAKLRFTLRGYRIAEFALAAIGIALGAAAGTWEIDWMATWVPVVTTINAAVIAHTAAERYAYLLVEYQRTGEELTRIRSRVGSAVGLSDADLIARAEAVISIQNEGWMAKLAGSLKD